MKINLQDPINIAQIYKSINEFIQKIELIINKEKIVLMEILNKQIGQSEIQKWENQLLKKNRLIFKDFQQKIVNYDVYFHEKFNQYIKNPLMAQLRLLQLDSIKYEHGYNLISFIIHSDFAIKQNRTKNQNFIQKISQLESKCQWIKQNIIYGKNKRENFNIQYKQKLKQYTKIIKDQDTLKRQKQKLKSIIKSQQKKSTKKQKPQSKSHFKKNRSYSQKNILSNQKKTAIFVQSVQKNYENLSKIDLIKQELEQYVKQNQRHIKKKYSKNIGQLVKAFSHKLDKIQKIGFIGEDLKACNDFVILSDCQNMLKFNQLQTARQVLHYLSSQDLLTVLIKQGKISEIMQLIEKQKHPYIKEIQKKKLQKISSNLTKQSKFGQKVCLLFNKKRQNLLKL